MEHGSISNGNGMELTTAIIEREKIKLEEAIPVLRKHLGEKRNDIYKALEDCLSISKSKLLKIVSEKAKKEKKVQKHAMNAVMEDLRKADATWKKTENHINFKKEG